MIRQKLHTFRYEDGSLERVQCVTLDSFDTLEFSSPKSTKGAFEQLMELYRDFIIKKYAAILGRVILFHLPENLELPYDTKDAKYGEVYDPLALLTIYFHKDIRLRRGELQFLSETTRQVYERLTRSGALYEVNGKLPVLMFLPVSENCGFLSKETGNQLTVNSSFFVMDVLDSATVFDSVGTPVGLKVKNNEVLSPPLFERPAFWIDDKLRSHISTFSLKEMKIRIDDNVFEDYKNARFYSRPAYRKTPKGGFDIIVSDNQIKAVKNGGNSVVPSSGYVIHLEHEITIQSREVTYEPLKNVRFALQVGNPAVIDSKPVHKFLARFYSLKKPWTPTYPPSLYPLNYMKDRAPRIILGTNAMEEPVLLWMEGAGKYGYVKGRDSAGASLSEAASICTLLKLKNAIHLDGGGSAQILIDQKRSLQLSDRDPDTFKEKERAVPAALIIRK